MSRHRQLRVQDLLDAIDRIGSYVAGMDYEHFLTDRKTQDAVTRRRREKGPETCFVGYHEICGEALADGLQSLQAT